VKNYLCLILYGFKKFYLRCLFIYFSKYMDFFFTLELQPHIYCYNYLNTVYMALKKTNVSIGEALPHREFSFLFCTLRAIDVFTDAGIHSHSLHFINLRGISSLLWIRLVSRSCCRARGCGIRSKICDGVFRIRDFFHPVRHQQTCGNKLKSESEKLQIWGFRKLGFCDTFMKVYHVRSSKYGFLYHFKRIF